MCFCAGDCGHQGLCFTLVCRRDGSTERLVVTHQIGYPCAWYDMTWHDMTWRLLVCACARNCACCHYPRLARVCCCCFVVVMALVITFLINMYVLSLYFCCCWYYSWLASEDMELAKEIITLPPGAGTFNTGLLTLSLKMPSLTRR